MPEIRNGNGLKNNFTLEKSLAKMFLLIANFNLFRGTIKAKY